MARGLGEYVEIGEDGSVKLNVDSALKLAYVHSPSHQSQLETLYLSVIGRHGGAIPIGYPVLWRIRRQIRPQRLADSTGTSL